jgi:proteasome accessory factor C
MPSRDTAEQKLNRLLYLLPAAARPEGVELGALAEALGVDRKKAGRDAIEASDRAYYLLAGVAADANVMLDGERVYLPTPNHFRRPVRLLAREAAALGMGLRSLATEASPVRRERLLELAGLVEREFALPGAEPARERVLAVLGDRPAGDLYEALRHAAAARRVCRIRYVKPGPVHSGQRAEPETRTVEPYALLFAERWWYAVSRCRDRQGIRLFRVDRVLDVEVLDEGFDVPADFDVRAHARDGRALVAGETAEATVRYAARVAAWIRERFPDAEEAADGAVVVRHRVADPHWLARHVLQYGRDAEVVEPRPLRELVRDRARRFLEVDVES